MAMNQKERLYAQMRKENKFLLEAYPYVMAMLTAVDKEGNKMFDGAEFVEKQVYFQWQGREMSVNWLDCEPEEIEPFIAFLDSIKRHSQDILKDGEQKNQEAAIYDAMEQIINEQTRESADGEMSQKYSLYSEGYQFVYRITHDYEAPDINPKDYFTKLLNSAHNTSASPIKPEEFEKLAQYYKARREISKNMREFKSAKKEYAEKKEQNIDKNTLSRIQETMHKMRSNMKHVIELAYSLNLEDKKNILSDSDYKKYFDAKAKFETAIAGKSLEEIEDTKYRSNDWQIMNRLEPEIKVTEAFKTLIDERKQVIDECLQVLAEIEPAIDDLLSKAEKLKKKEESAEKTGNNLDALFGAEKLKTTETSAKASSVKNGDNIDAMFNASSAKGKAMSGSQKSVD